jgi:hypothetical protein
MMTSTSGNLQKEAVMAALLAKEGTRLARDKLEAFQFQMNLKGTRQKADVQQHWHKCREAFEAAAQADIEAAALEEKADGCAEAARKAGALLTSCGGYAGSEAQAANEATITFNAATLTGTSVSTQVPQSYSVGLLKDELRKKLNISAENPLSITFNDETLGPDTAKLQSLDCIRQLAEDNSTLAVSVVVLSMVKVKRHIYNARGGAPPHRGSYLTSTEEIELDPTMTLGNQMHKIVPGHGAGKGMGKMGKTKSKFETKSKFAPNVWIWHADEVPRKWGEDEGADIAKPERLFSDCVQLPEIFAKGGKSLVILIPMLGMD